MQTLLDNRINRLLADKSQNKLSIYFTAGFPALNDTRTILMALQEAGADMVEIGIPFSDPVADGPTIQASNQKALENGMTLRLLFEQLEGIREGVDMPLILMGYLNPVVQFGMEAFCKEAARVGIDGLIIPDLPLAEYERQYKGLFESYGLKFICLITPQTSEARIRQIDALSDSFIYMVSSAATTGAKQGVSNEQIQYFERVNAMNLRNPKVVGFGISDADSFRTVGQYAEGAIIGSAFIRMLESSTSLKADILRFIQSIKVNSSNL
ncbi:tryptophan synthase subunit alpha [Cytophagales bacterium LB-30]|uniref:Tryptophan synthase alpha chain n=1 Tax=Shiella aurantiaca TaxID=3058365 RepID=A0ABT8F7J3_9BACT|nr:tryptophan synthase subunit alpha [Shiella aurantiaca]MDN4166447.1 tryptophan synthase subunit alpha [Shiella aurantiaca]